MEEESYSFVFDNDFKKWDELFDEKDRNAIVDRIKNKYVDLEKMILRTYNTLLESHVESGKCRLPKVYTRSKFQIHIKLRGVSDGRINMRLILEAPGKRKRIYYGSMGNIFITMIL